MSRVNSISTEYTLVLICKEVRSTSAFSRVTTSKFWLSDKEVSISPYGYNIFSKFTRLGYISNDEVTSAKFDNCTTAELVFLVGFFKKLASYELFMCLERRVFAHEAMLIPLRFVSILTLSENTLKFVEKTSRGNRPREL